MWDECVQFIISAADVAIDAAVGLALERKLDATSLYPFLCTFSAIFPHVMSMVLEFVVRQAETIIFPRMSDNCDIILRP